jgi:hypothetical protein
MLPWWSQISDVSKEAPGFDEGVKKVGFNPEAL